MITSHVDSSVGWVLRVLNENTASNRGTLALGWTREEEAREVVVKEIEHSRKRHGC